MKTILFLLSVCLYFVYLKNIVKNTIKVKPTKNMQYRKEKIIDSDSIDLDHIIKLFDEEEATQNKSIDKHHHENQKHKKEMDFNENESLDYMEDQIIKLFAEEEATQNKSIDEHHQVNQKHKKEMDFNEKDLDEMENQIIELYLKDATTHTTEVHTHEMKEEKPMKKQHLIFTYKHIQKVDTPKTNNDTGRAQKKNMNKHSKKKERFHKNKTNNIQMKEVADGMDMDLKDDQTIELIEENKLTTLHSSGTSCKIHYQCASDEVCTSAGMCRNVDCKTDQDCKEQVNLPVSCVSVIPGGSTFCYREAYCDSDEECKKAGETFRCQPDTYQCKPTSGPCEETSDCVSKYKMAEGEAVCTKTVGGSGSVCMCRSEYIAECKANGALKLVRLVYTI